MSVNGTKFPTSGVRNEMDLMNKSDDDLRENHFYVDERDWTISISIREPANKNDLTKWYIKYRRKINH